MKDAFYQFANLDQTDTTRVWKKGTFVFDTNVLLNLYKYTESTRNQVINVLEKLADRIWIPHHVGLEFYLKRYSIISEQTKQINEISGSIRKFQNKLFASFDELSHKKDRTDSELADCHKKISSTTKALLEKMSLLENDNIQSSGKDIIKETIEHLFANKVGKAPVAQKEVDKLYTEAENQLFHIEPKKYKLEIPSLANTPDYYGTDIVYKRKYSDFLIWQQTLEHAQKNNIKKLVFVTDDIRTDWWELVDQDGPKTLGPRIALIREAKARGIQIFHMYSSGRFLRDANKHFSTEIPEETLKTIDSVSQNVKSMESALLKYMAVSATLNWMDKKNLPVSRSLSSDFEFEVTYNSNMYPLKVIWMEDLVPDKAWANKVLASVKGRVEKDGLLGAYLTFVSSDMLNAQEAHHVFSQICCSHICNRIITMFGVYDSCLNEFIPALANSGRIEKNSISA